jgi:rhodanese-related sulfurtransferase
MKPTTIPAPELAALLARDAGLTVIDVRTPAEFAALHAAPARNLPLPDVTPNALAALGHADATRPVYLLCQSGKRAESACARLTSAGFVQAVVVTGGTEAWAAAGLPVVRGAGDAIGLERQVRIGVGALVVVGVVLAQMVHPGFVWLSAFIGAGLVFAGVTGFCGMGLLLAKAPWNRA